MPYIFVVSNFGNCTLVVHDWSMIKLWCCGSLEWARLWKCFILSHGKLKENVLFILLS